MAASSADAGRGDGPAGVGDAVRDALDVIAVQRGFRRPRYHVEAGSSLGDGYTSIVYRITINEEAEAASTEVEPTAELRVICKTAEGAPGFLGMAFAAEDCVYSRLLPAVEALGAVRESRPWPRCYHSTVGGPTSSPVLVLEDLQPLGFRMADRSEPLDERHCRLALRQLARFHGAGMALQYHKPDTFEDLTAGLGKAFKDPDVNETFKEFFTALETAPALVKERFSGEVFARYQEHVSNYCANFVTTMTSPGSGPGYALVHGDCHTNNIMFQYDKVVLQNDTTDGALTDCKLIDFQTVRFGCTVWDIGSLLLPCTDKTMRDAQWDSLLRGYHNELQATLRAAGVDHPDAVYSWDQFMDAMRREFRFALTMAPMLLHLLLADGEAARKLRDAIHDADGQQEGDEEGPAAVAAIHIRDSPQLRQRLGDVVQDLLDWGWL